MNSHELRNLQEAYMDVYSSPDYLKESKPQLYWTDTSLKGANKDPNGIDPEHERRRIEFNKRIRQTSRGKGSAAERRAIGRGLIPDTRIKVKEDLEFILDYLLDEGYADTQEQAEVIMVNMSEDWRESIYEGYKKLPVGKMMRKVQNRATREAETRAEVDFDRYPTTEVVKAAQRAARDDERSDQMMNVADAHNEKEAKRKEKDNRRIGGRKRDAGRPRSNELQDNW